MVGKQKGGSSRALSLDNESPSCDSYKLLASIQTLSDKVDSKFADFDSKFATLHNEVSSSNVRMQACETQGTALAADLNAVKADTGLTGPLFIADMLAITQCLAIEGYNRLYFFDQPERVENSRFRVLRTSVSTTLPVDLPSQNTWSNHTQLVHLPQPPPPTTSAPLTRPHPPHPLPKPISNAPHLSYVTSQAQAEESFSPCPPPAAIPLAKPLPPSKANTRGKLSPTPLPAHTPLPHVAPLCTPPTPTPTPPLPN